MHVSPQVAMSPAMGAAGRLQTPSRARFSAAWFLGGLAMVGLVVFALFLGLTTVFLPWYFHVLLVLAVSFPLLVFKAPWTAFGLYLAGVFIAPGFKSADGLTLVALTLFTLRWLAAGRPPLLPAWLARPYLVFLAAVGVAGMLGLVVYRYKLGSVYGDGRGFVYWLWLPLLYSLVTQVPDGLRKLARVLAVVAGLITLVALFQYFTGIQIVASGRVGGLDAGDADQTRVQMHGFLFVSFALVWAMVALVHRPGRVWWLLPAMAVLAVAIYVNLGRALWFWTAVALVLSVGAAGWRRGWAIAAVMITALVFGGTALVFLKPKVVDSIAERVESVRGEGGPRTSYGWRRLENEDALPHILRRPFTGMGLGAEYRRWMHEVARFEEHTRYVHNSYVFILLKSGVFALAGLLALLARALWRGWKTTRAPGLVARPLRVAGVAMVLPMLGISVTQPELVTPMSVLLFSMVVILLGYRSAADDVSPAASADRPEAAV